MGGIMGFFMVYVAAFGMGDVYGNGQVAGLHVEGYMLSTTMVMIAMTKGMLVTTHWNLFGALAYGLSFLSYILVSVLYLEVPMGGTLASPVFWMVLPVTMSVCLLPSYVIRAAS